MSPLALSLLATLAACGGGPSSDGLAEEKPMPERGTSTAASGEEAPSGGGSASGDACDDRSGADVSVENDCLSGELTCGGTVRGHTENGGSRWTGPFYQKKFCEARVDEYAGEERVYRFRMEKQQAAEITLKSPCADLDLFVLQWSEDTCPAMRHGINACEGDTSRGGGKVLLEAIQNPRNFIVVVEGKGEVDAPFELSAKCRSRTGP